MNLIVSLIISIIPVIISFPMFNYSESKRVKVVGIVFFFLFFMTSYLTLDKVDYDHNLVIGVAVLELIIWWLISGVVFYYQSDEHLAS